MLQASLTAESGQNKGKPLFFEPRNHVLEYDIAGDICKYRNHLQLVSVRPGSVGQTPRLRR